MPKITRIAQQVKDESRYSVFVDGKFAFGCREERLADLEIHEGDEISAAQLDEIGELLQKDNIRQKALWYLGRRNRSVLEMRRYLQRKGYDVAEIESTIEWLIGKKYLNDQVFSEEWVRMRTGRNSRGRKGLMRELAVKGIDRETANRVVDEVLPDEGEAESAIELLTAKKNRFGGMERLEMKRKIYNFLGYRGFSLEAIGKAYRKFAGGKDVEEDEPSGKDS